MDQGHAEFTGSIPENYDQGLGPMIFVDYGAAMARMAAEGTPARVLEIAAGTGIVSRLIRDALPAEAHLTISDLNPPMLDYAQDKFQAGEAVTFEPADATALPFGDEQFDTAVCQFGVMFFPDKPKAYREVHRVLEPGGRYLFSVWDSFVFNRFAEIAHETIATFFPDHPPGFYKLPFSCHEIDPIKQSLIDAGFGEISVHVKQLEKDIPSAAAFAQGAVFGNPVIEEIRARGSAEPEQVKEAIAEAMQAAFGADPGRMSLQSIFFSARKV